MNAQSKIIIAVVAILAAGGAYWAVSSGAISTGGDMAATETAAASTTAAAADGADAPASGAYREFIYGDPNAKVTIIEYASLTCPHCADFTQNVFPTLKENYLDTGKARLVFRDYPLDGLAMAGAVLARCAPGDRGKVMIELMFQNQQEWVRAAQPIEPLKGYAQLAGMTGEDVDACLKNQELLAAIRDVQNTADSLYQVRATPTFFIGEEKVEGNPGYEALSAIIDEQLE